MRCLVLLLVIAACAEFDIKDENRFSNATPRPPLRMNPRNAALVLVEGMKVVASADAVAVRRCFVDDGDEAEPLRTCDVLVVREGEIVDEVRTLDPSPPKAFSCKRSYPGAKLDCGLHGATWSEQVDTARGAVSKLVARTMPGPLRALASDVFANSVLSSAPYHARMQHGVLEIVDARGTRLADVMWPFGVTAKRAIAVHRGPGVLVAEVHTEQSNGFAIFALDEHGGVDLDGIVPPR